MSLEGGPIQGPRDAELQTMLSPCSQKWRGREPELHGAYSPSHPQKHSDATELPYAKSDGQGNLLR